MNIHPTMQTAILPFAPRPGVSKITLLAKRVYGEIKFYPVCEKAHLFANIAGTCTLTRRSIDSIKALGVEIVLQQEEVTL